MGGAFIRVSRSEHWRVRRPTIQRRTMIVPHRYTIKPRPSSEQWMGGSSEVQKFVRGNLALGAVGCKKLLAERLATFQLAT